MIKRVFMVLLALCLSALPMGLVVLADDVQDAQVGMSELDDVVVQDDELEVSEDTSNLEYGEDGYFDSYGVWHGHSDGEGENDDANGGLFGVGDNDVLESGGIVVSLSSEQWEALLLVLSPETEGTDVMGLSEVPELPEPPDLSEYVEDGLMSFQPAGIGTQTAYPYTGGSMAYLSTSLGNIHMLFPETYKSGYFGFYKGTDRIINLSNGTISGYIIRSGTTYNARFTSLGTLEYYYQSGSNYYWGAVTVNSVLDSNINWLDETGERGIENVQIPVWERLAIFVSVVGVCLVVGGRFIFR